MWLTLTNQQRQLMLRFEKYLSNGVALWCVPDPKITRKTAPYWEWESHIEKQLAPSKSNSAVPVWMRTPQVTEPLLTYRVTDTSKASRPLSLPRQTALVNPGDCEMNQQCAVSHKVVSFVMQQTLPDILVVYQTSLKKEKNQLPLSSALPSS